MADSLVPGGGNIPIDHNTPVGGVGNIGSFLEITPNTPGPSGSGVKWARFYLNGNEIRIPPGLAHHRIIISENTTAPTHYCKKIQNVIDYDTMWNDGVSEELYKNAITYYYILCPNKRYNEDNDGISYNCRKDEVGLLSYSYINKYYDQNNQQWDYGWGPNKYWITIGSDTPTSQTGLLDTNVPYYEGFNAETDSNNDERNTSTFENHNFNQNAPNNLMLSYGTFRLVNALADIYPY